MQIDIQSQGFPLTDGLRDYLMKRLAYGLNHGDEYITRVSVRLSDINGPRGGADKRCLIEVRLKAAPAVVIEDTEADLYVAIDRAAERAGRTLARRLARQREFAPDLPTEQEGTD
ncbi:MAG: HPF/RaiA family ribosome-associated protein [Gammaproteobacteria bacterium]|nr:HPF/RaiA family ribosome-associated protein [Gammaproteobacteria bacterium]MBU1654235.1 HPF/RaiA family ribosome-associated protein [Gammaproteobacteria bacterium]